jgi:hypothetical protein
MAYALCSVLRVFRKEKGRAAPADLPLGLTHVSHPETSLSFTVHLHLQRASATAGETFRSFSLREGLEVRNGEASPGLPEALEALWGSWTDCGREWASLLPPRPGSWLPLTMSVDLKPLKPESSRESVLCCCFSSHLWVPGKTCNVSKGKVSQVGPTDKDRWRPRDA